MKDPEMDGPHQSIRTVSDYKEKLEPSKTKMQKIKRMEQNNQAM